MDWESVRADVYRPIRHSFTSGRQGRGITGVTVHHMAGDLTVGQCFDLWSRSGTSAHYAVQADGTIGQLVDDADTAWACGDWEANLATISVEHANDRFGPWTVGAKALDAGAHLVAALCRYYGLGRPRWLVNVFPHRHWSATACPGELYGSQKDGYMSRCQEWYDYMTGAGAAPEGDDDMRLMEQNVVTRGGSNVNAGQAVGWGYAYAKDASEATERIEGKMDALEKKMAALAPDRERVRLDYGAIADELAKRGGLKVDIDYERLAKAVNDDAAKRMAE